MGPKGWGERRRGKPRAKRRDGGGGKMASWEGVGEVEGEERGRQGGRGEKLGGRGGGKENEDEEKDEENEAKKKYYGREEEEETGEGRITNEKNRRNIGKKEEMKS